MVRSFAVAPPPPLVTTSAHLTTLVIRQVRLSHFGDEWAKEIAHRYAVENVQDACCQGLLIEPVTVSCRVHEEGWYVM